MVLASALLASGAVFAQSEVAATDPETQLLGQIAELRDEGGPNPSGLIDPLRALALLYEETGDHVLAVAALEEARDLTRIHQGLSSADEALLLRQQIRSEKALGLHRRVWDLEQDMVTIARQHHDDLRMVPVFRELGDDRLDALREYRSGGFPPEVELGCYYVTGPRRYDDTRGKVRPPANSRPVSCISGSRRDVVNALRSESLMYYADAIEVIVKNGDYASQELRELEARALAVTTLQVFAPSFCAGTINELVALPLVGSCLDPVMHLGNTVVPNIGWASLVRLIAYEVRSGSPAAARANALAELADWHLFAGRRFADTGLELYERAYRELEQADDVQAAAQIFSPEVPVTLPTLARNPFAFAATESSRYIDVSFDITKYGRGERVEILDSSKGATRAEERDLTRLIEGTSFRPRVVDGGIADSARVIVRYTLGP
jgi:hypothetical protein